MRKFVIDKVIDKKSIQNRVRQSTLIVLLVQVILFGSIIIGGGTISRLSEEYFKSLNGSVISRKKYLEDTMLKQWSDLAEFENEIQMKAWQYNIQVNSQLNQKFLEKVAAKMINVIRQHSVTGAFFVLEGEGSREGLYIRDIDLLMNPADNSDLSLVKGSADIGKSMNISLDRQWEHKFHLEKDKINSAFYYKPFAATIKYPTYSTRDLGYWSKPFRLSENDIEVITYSIPLKDRQGDPYAVIGIELSLDYLQNSLYYEELVENKGGGYLLGIEEDEAGTFYKVLSSGPILNRYIGSDEKIAFTSKADSQDIHILNNNIFNNKVYGSIQYLNLYNAKTPFINDKWALIGMVGNKTLFKPIKRLGQSILLALLFSLAMGMVAAYITGAWFVRPITKLVQRVLTSDPSSPILLSKTNISEIDELASAIESLSIKVADSSSKLSQIISMVNIPIGAFEYDLKGKEVFCTGTLFGILGIQKKAGEDNSYITSTHLKQLITQIVQSPETDMENVYSYKIEGEHIKWIRMQTQQDGGKVLGVIEDVTVDVAAKHKIEYERDHDVLTQLLNRRAFNRKVKRKLKKETVYNAAFVMWDLDNLKYINDTYGHDYGDQYIKTAAAILNESTIYNAIVARMSGDEFYTFIYGYKDKDEIREKIQEIQHKLYTTLLTMPDGTIFRIRASGGVAWYPDDSRNYDELIKYSDFAMYEIKHSDKGNVAEFDKQTYDKDYILLYGKEELNQFIEEELVIYNFQPIIDVKNREVFGYEALMRPQVETLKSPLDILRLAQSQSKLYDIERLTWFKAMEAFELHKKQFGDAKIFINSIPNHALTERDLARFEEKYKDDLGRIVLEIIENEQGNEVCTKTKQDAVTRWGSHLAIDDFGSGYNNEMSLLILSPKYIKIDMTIIRGIHEDKNRQKLLENILSYAKSRDIKIIAEGIETKEEMYKVIELGVDYLQGYYLGTPQISPQTISPHIVQEIFSFDQSQRSIIC